MKFKKITGFLLLTVMANASHAKTVVVNNAWLEQRGRVVQLLMSRSEYPFILPNGPVKEARFLTHDTFSLENVYEYDESGRLIKTSHYMFTNRRRLDDPVVYNISYSADGFEIKDEDRGDIKCKKRKNTVQLGYKCLGRVVSVDYDEKNRAFSWEGAKGKSWPTGKLWLDTDGNVTQALTSSFAKPDQIFREYILTYDHKDDVNILEYKPGTIDSQNKKVAYHQVYHINRDSHQNPTSIKAVKRSSGIGLGGLNVEIKYTYY